MLTAKKIMSFLAAIALFAACALLAGCGGGGGGNSGGPTDQSSITTVVGSRIALPSAATSGASSASATSWSIVSGTCGEVNNSGIFTANSSGICTVCAVTGDDKLYMMITVLPNDGTVNMADYYYDLHVGNEWEYVQTAGGTKTYSISGTETLGSKTYYQLNLGQTELVRFDEAFTCMYNYGTESGGSIATNMPSMRISKFRVGQTYTSSWLVYPSGVATATQRVTETDKVSGTGVSITTEAGKFDDCIHVVTTKTIANLSGGAWKVSQAECYYAKGIGLVKVAGFDENGASISGHLKYAKVNGTNHGTP